MPGSEQPHGLKLKPETLGETAIHQLEIRPGWQIPQHLPLQGHAFLRESRPDRQLSAALLLRMHQRPHGFDILCREMLQRQIDASATALSEIRSQRHTAEGKPPAAFAHAGKRPADRLELQRSAADGSGNAAICTHDHARTRLTRGGSGRCCDGDEAAGPTFTQLIQNPPPEDHRAPPACRMACTALRIASGVAGASSCGTVPGRSEATASVMAQKTELASITGGSPTALER